MSEEKEMQCIRSILHLVISHFHLIALTQIIEQD